MSDFTFQLLVCLFVAGFHFDSHMVSCATVSKCTKEQADLCLNDYDFEAIDLSKQEETCMTLSKMAGCLGEVKADCKSDVDSSVRQSVDGTILKIGVISAECGSGNDSPSGISGIECVARGSNVCAEDFGTLNFTDTAKTCPLLRTMLQCVKDFGQDCTMTEDDKRAKEQTLLQVNSAMAICKGVVDVCYDKAQACLKPYETIQNTTTDTSKICQEMQTSSKCLNKVHSSCENETTKKQVETVILGLVEQGGVSKSNCKKSGYPIQGVGAGNTIQPTIAVVLLSTLFVALTL